MRRPLGVPLKVMWALAGFVAVTGFAVAQEAQDKAGEPPPEPWMDKLNETYRSGETTCDFTAFGQVVEFYGRSGQESVQSRVLDWFATFDERLPAPVGREAYDTLIASLRAGDLANRAEHLSGMWDLKHSSLAARKRIYGDATSHGFARLPNGSAINSYVALEQAALDGVNEVVPELERMDSEERANGQRVQFGRVMLWYARLRESAVDREDARRLHLERLRQMAPQQFHQLMVGDRSFRIATLETVSDTCYRARSPKCSIAAELLDAWKEYLVEIRRFEEMEVESAPGAPARLGLVVTYFATLVNQGTR